MGSCCEKCCPKENKIEEEKAKGGKDGTEQQQENQKQKNVSNKNEPIEDNNANSDSDNEYNNNNNNANNNNNNNNSSPLAVEMNLSEFRHRFTIGKTLRLPSGELAEGTNGSIRYCEKKSKKNQQQHHHHHREKGGGVGAAEGEALLIVKHVKPEKYTGHQSKNKIFYEREIQNMKRIQEAFAEGEGEGEGAGAGEGQRKQQGHPNLAKLVAYCWSAEGLYLVMPFEGCDVFEQLMKKQKALDEKVARRVTQGLWEAVSFLHSLDISHRDLKPENILYDKRERRAVLVDFGCSKLEGNGEALVTVQNVFSPPYIPPEVLCQTVTMEQQQTQNKSNNNNNRQGFLPYNNKCDLFSFGVTMCFYLTAILPWYPKGFPNGLLDVSERDDKTGLVYLKRLSEDMVKENWRKAEVKEKLKVLGYPENEVFNLIEKLLKPNPEERASLEDIRKCEFLFENYHDLNKK